MTSKTNQKFGKLFAKKKKQTARVKLVDDHDDKEIQVEKPAKADIEVSNKPDHPEQSAKQVQKEEAAQQPEKKQKRGPTFNWFDDDQDQQEDQIPDAGLDLIKDRRQIQSQKKKEEANKRGQEFWDDEAVQGAQSLVQKRNNQQIEKERIKKQQDQLLKNAKTDKQIFKAYNLSFFNGSAKPNQVKNTGVNLAEEEFISLEEQTQMAKIGKKKAAAMSSNAQSSQTTATSEQVDKAAKPQQSKYKNQFRDLGGDRDSEDEQDTKKQKKKFVIGDKKPGEYYQKKPLIEQDKGWMKGTGQVETQEQQRKRTAKKQDKGFQLGGGIIQQPRIQTKNNEDQITFSRLAFGSGQVQQQSIQPFKKRQFNGRQSNIAKGFKRQEFGTGKIQLQEERPRKSMKNMNDGEERRSKNETWTKGGGLGVSKRSEFFFKDNNRGQKQEPQRAKQVQTQSKAAIKKEAKVLVNEDKNENCWDEDL